MNALLAIDFQNDFVLPTGALSVKGAVDDAKRVAKFLAQNGDKLDTLIFTLDSHRTIDISHPCWWLKPDGTHIDPLTPISYQQLLDGVYTPAFAPGWSLQYVKKLEDEGEFGHFIWPYHCLIGSEGHAIVKEIHNEINLWESKYRKPVTFVTKGDNPYTEHFGAFRANVEMAEDPKTQINQALLKTLITHNNVFLVGEARSHCVVNSLKQAIKEAPQLASKIVVLEDTMSDVPGLPAAFYDSVNNIYEEAKQKGVRFAKSTDNF